MSGLLYLSKCMPLFTMVGKREHPATRAPFLCRTAQAHPSIATSPKVKYHQIILNEYHWGRRSFEKRRKQVCQSEPGDMTSGKMTVCSPQKLLSKCKCNYYTWGSERKKLRLPGQILLQATCAVAVLEQPNLIRITMLLIVYENGSHMYREPDVAGRQETSPLLGKE